MRRFPWTNWPLAATLTLTMTLTVAITIASVTLVAISREQQSFRAELQQQAGLLLDALAGTVSDPLYYLDIGTLQDTMEGLVATQTLASGRIYNKEGRIIADGYDPLLALGVTNDAFGQRLVGSDTPVFDWQPDHLLAGRAVTLGNQRIGAISIGLSTVPLQAKVAAVRNQGLRVAVVTVIIGALLALMVSRSITRPLQQLVRATDRIAGGDLSQKIAIGGSDELTVLGNAMERMRAELQQFYQELEQRVAERTQALQESEDRFRHVVSSISAHVYVTEMSQDGEHFNRYIAPNVEALTGYPLEKFLADWSFWPSTVIHPDDRAAAAAQATRLATGQNSEVEYRLVRADDRVIWVRDSGRVEKDPTSQSFIVYGVVSDITERKQVEATLAWAHDQAIEASRLKTELLAKVSHELRTPLGAILGFTEMLEVDVYGPLSDKKRQMTTKIIDNTHYLIGLVNELLDQAQLEAGRLKLNIHNFTPADLVDATLATMNVLAQAKGLSLTSDIAADVPTTLWGDPARLQQILVNLISNAIKFTAAGAVQVRLYCPDADHWALQVCDTGSGIPAEARGYIFEPFRQVDGSMTRAHTGAGLGLSIVKHLTTLMGGEITLDSEVGRGSAFTVSLPRQPIQEEIE